VTDLAFGKVHRGRAPPSTRCIAGAAAGAEEALARGGGAGAAAADEDGAPPPPELQPSNAGMAHAAQRRVPAGIMTPSMPESAPMTRLLPLVAALVVAGCGGMVVFEEDDGGAGGDDGSVTTTSASKSSSVSSGSGPSSVLPNIIDVKLGVNCQPVVGPDPITGSVLISYDNTGSGPGSLDLVNAQIYVSTPREGWVFPIELSPSTSGVVQGGSSAQVDHQKVTTPGDSSFICSLCGFEATLVVNLEQDDGTDVADSAAFFIGCAL
jgi:hypothetical protein